MIDNYNYNNMIITMINMNATNTNDLPLLLIDTSGTRKLQKQPTGPCVC